MRSLANSKHLWRVWLAGGRSSIVREMEFRANFLIGIMSQLGWCSAYLFMIEIIFRNTSQIAGWNKAEVLVIFALSRLIEGLMRMLFTRNILQIPQMIRRGTMDFLLMRPVPAQWYAAFGRVMIYEVGNITIGILLLMYAFSLQAFSFTAQSFLIFLSLVIAGMAIFYSLLIMIASLGFLLERFESFYAFIVILTEPFTVPFEIFPRLPRLAITYLIPLAFVVFVPAQALTGRLAWWQVPVAAFLAALLLLLANLAWRAGLRKYSSASS